MTTIRKDFATGCCLWLLMLAAFPLVAIAQDVVPPFSLPEIEAATDDEATYVPIEKRPGREERKEKRKHKHDEPQPDQDPDEGESVVTPDHADELAPIEGHEEREARKKRHHEEQERHRDVIEKQRREQEEYERLHPKPVQPTGIFGFVWSWVVAPVIGTFFAPFAWFFTLSKWAIGLILLIVLALIVTAVVFFGSVVWSVCSWLWGSIKRTWTKPKPQSPSS